MTLYEILSIVSPVLTVIIGGLITYIFKSLDRRLTTLENKFDIRISSIEKEVYFIKGLIEGKNISSSK